jgi:hypothetical protein
MYLINKLTWRPVNEGYSDNTKKLLTIENFIKIVPDI